MDEANGGASIMTLSSDQSEQNRAVEPRTGFVDEDEEAWLVVVEFIFPEHNGGWPPSY